jgi:multiple RNA-binding domain-containing protein 1
VPLKKIDGKGKGFAFVQFKEAEQAVEAYDDTDGTIFQGRLLHIISAKAKKDTSLNEYEISKLPLKKQKEIQRKQNATRNTFNWNSLYLNVSHTVSEVVFNITNNSPGRCSYVHNSKPYGHQQS